LKGLKPANPEREGDYREKWATPAYIRRNVNLQDIPHSSEKNVSKYNLNDDNQILGNNTFLHDNVD
ncbi:MAG: cell division protein FtsZ, partial [Cyclobacteriaceae bacterium]|nr:cell division protein FtsZ [Cyclobacteriaceae bacterium]